MHFSNAAKAIFLIINHLVACHVQPNLVLDARLNGDAYGSDSSLASRDLTSNPGMNTILFTRRGDSCQNCRSRCPTGKIFDSENCRKCVRCPKGKTPNRTAYKCVRTKDEKKKKRDKYDEKKKAKTADYKDKGKRFKKKKEEKKTSYKDKRVEDKRKKVRRMGRCLPLVPLSMGSVAAEEFSAEFFDEDYLESMELLELWPDSLPIDPWFSEEDDKIYESDDYVDKWIDIGEKVESRSFKSESRSLASRSIKASGFPKEMDPSELNLITDIAVRSEDHELVARCPLCFLIPIFQAAAAVAGRVAAGAARAGVKLSRTTIKVAKGRGSKRTKKEQRDGAKDISKNRNWVKCLKKQSPESVA